MPQPRVVVVLLVAALSFSAFAAPSALGATPPKKCRYLSGKVSLNPFPNDAFTKRAGGRRPSGA